MQFSTVVAVASVAAVASAASNSTTVTDVRNSTTLVTITSCESHTCVESVSPALVSTATVTIDNVVTLTTTWCPLPETSAAKPSQAPSTAAKPSPAPSSSSVPSVPQQTGAAAKALPAVGALFAGAAALLL